MIGSIVMLIVFHFILPGVFLFMIWRADVQSKLEWGLFILSTTMYNLWIFLSGNWDWFSYYLRYVLILVFIILIFISWKRLKSKTLEIKSKRSHRLSIGINLFLIAIFGLYNSFIITSYSTDDEALELSFPLYDGVYYVGHGGSHPMMNYHNEYEPQQYALDIVKLNSIGARANGLFPKELSKYAIYQENLYSPCSGEVLESRSYLDDLIPPKSDPNNALGNYLALTCDDSEAVVYIAHMNQASVTVEAGSKVEEGDLIGKVGNSGNTSEPHLHIHAEKDGIGIPITFDGHFLVRNQLVW